MVIVFWKEKTLALSQPGLRELPERWFGREYFPAVSVWATITKYHRRVAHKPQKFIPHSSEGRKSEVRVPAWSGSGEGSRLACRH